MFAFNPKAIKELFARIVELSLRPLGIENSRCPLRRNVDIETLSDDVLLEIFHKCLVKDEDVDPWGPSWNDDPRGEDEADAYDAWLVLVHVCQRWRYIVFASPRHLNLRLFCSERRLTEMLGVWPAFPIVIWDRSYVDDIMTALKHRDRVCEIKFELLSRSLLEKLAPLMQESFPALTKLQIGSPLAYHELVKSMSFLGQLDVSAPRLRFLRLAPFVFPESPNLLLSAGNLVHLYLDGVTSGYVSPEMVAAISALTKLEVLHFVFRYYGTGIGSGLNDSSPPPSTRSVLPTLKTLELIGNGGNGKYMDDLAARIDVPSLKYLKINFYRPFLLDNFSHLFQFIGRVENFRSFDFTVVELSTYYMEVRFSPRISRHGSHPGRLQLKFIRDPDVDGPLPLPSLLDITNVSLLPLSEVEHFFFSTRYPFRRSQSGFNVQVAQCLGVLRQISAAKSLHLGSMDTLLPVASALKQIIEEGMTDVLTAIQELKVSGSLSESAEPVREAIEQFVTARGLSIIDSTTWRRRDNDEG